MKKQKLKQSGKLRIGDDWNAITIIALSQDNPLKAVAEFVENSIDAGATQIVITRGKEKGQPYLKVVDDGEGIPRDKEGRPDFQYVATHICDSIKRRLKSQGTTGIQGEFGIGLLSFWTVGEELLLTSPGEDGRTYQMKMKKGDPGFSVSSSRRLFASTGTELKIRPLLPGLRQLTGEKIQWYLASELRDRIRQTGVKIRIVDRISRKEYQVKPRRFTGRLLQRLPRIVTDRGEVYVEIYLADADPARAVGLYRSGTRILKDLTQIDVFQKAPWSSRYLEGLIDAPFLTLTPGTRTGIVQDERFFTFCSALEPLEEALNATVEELQRVEQEKSSRQMLRTIQKAFQEAMLALPPEEYDWFDVRTRSSKVGSTTSTRDEQTGISVPQHDEAADAEADGQKRFFEFAGPLHSVRVTPASAIVKVSSQRNFRAIPRDRRGRLVEDDMAYTWEIIEGEGRLENEDGEIVTLHAPAEPGLTRMRVLARQRTISCEAEAVCTITETLIRDQRISPDTRQGLPGYTFQRDPGELWRSRFDSERNVIVINNGHRDFVYASRTNALKLRYIARLFAKEMVYRNFKGSRPADLLERLIELSLYTEENLR